MARIGCPACGPSICHPTCSFTLSPPVASPTLICCGRNSATSTVRSCPVSSLSSEFRSTYSSGLTTGVRELSWCNRFRVYHLFQRAGTGSMDASRLRARAWEAGREAANSFMKRDEQYELPHDSYHNVESRPSASILWKAYLFTVVHKVGISDNVEISDKFGDAWPQSRRKFVGTVAAVISVAIIGLLPDYTEASEADIQNGAASSNQESKAASATSSTADPSSVPPGSTIRKGAINTESWYRFRGEGFAIRVPPEFEDIVEPDEGGTSLYGERAKERPFAARFASPDRLEVLSVVIRQASQLRLSFFEAKDISEFGSLQEAARMFVPGATLMAARTMNSADSSIPRTYYLYEFVAKDKRVVMSAAAAGGKVFVMGAMAPQSKWKEVGRTLRSAATSFAIL